MKHIRYYAIGHSYLLHGPFDGWQTDGFWGMAASEPQKDYFHRFKKMLEEEFDAVVEALPENHADFERCCTADATRETYLASKNYSHMEEVLQSFKPNIITVFIGGGNTIAKDEKSLGLFFEVLYEMINKNKRDDTVVICVFAKHDTLPFKLIAEKKGFIVADCTEIHTKVGDKYPYYAFEDYPEYSEKAAMGAVEFRTHPGNAGHEKIASILFEKAKDEIGKKIPDGAFAEDYIFEKYIVNRKIEKFHIQTTPEFFVNFNGFNVRQNNEMVSFSSAPGTGASASAYGICISNEYKKFYIEMSVGGVTGNEKLLLTLNSKSGEHKYSQIIPDDKMRKYVFDISDIGATVTRMRVSPELSECFITVKSLGFEK